MFVSVTLFMSRKKKVKSLSFSLWDIKAREPTTVGEENAFAISKMDTNGFYLCEN